MGIFYLNYFIVDIIENFQLRPVFKEKINVVFIECNSYNPACLHKDIQPKLLVRANMELDLTYHPKNNKIHSQRKLSELQMPQKTSSYQPGKVKFLESRMTYLNIIFEKRVLILGLSHFGKHELKVLISS